MIFHMLHPIIRLLLLPFCASITWNSSYESQPAGSDKPSEGDDRIRELKAAIRAADDHEHQTLDQTDANRGWHRAGSAKAYLTTAAPTLRPDNATALGTGDKGRIWGSDSGTYVTLKAWNGTSFSYTHAPLRGSTLNALETISAYSFSIGAWNMQGSSTIQRALPSSFNKTAIRDVKVIIIADGPTSVFPLEYNPTAADRVGGAWKIVGSTAVASAIVLVRNPTDFFSNASFNSNGNRGRVTVLYALA